VSERRIAPLLVFTLACACEAAKPPPEQINKPAVTGVLILDDDEHMEPRPPRTPASAPSVLPKEPRPFTPVPAPKDVASPPKDATRTKSGLVMKVLAAGTGNEKPKVEDRVKVHYTGWSKSGAMFDSSVARGEPKIFRVDQLNKAFTEALPLMVVGEKRRLWVPPSLAYGDKPPDGVPAGNLVFDLELLDIYVQPLTPRVPEDVKAPPESATKTASGLAYRWLKKGAGTEHPNEQSRVMIHYSGFTPEGVMFDSSIPRGRPSTLALRQTIKGLAEGLKLMAVGDQMRLWIPSELAYGADPRRGGAPAGPVVFDVELISLH
jgi:FKBP-type peptidyl-prolyl cis-trans isomerase